MPFTFECGICHSTYRLDEQQITTAGVKITCPKCLNFFFLKKGATTPTESPVIEYVVRDGAYEVRVPPPAPNEMTADQLLKDEDESPVPVKPPPPPPKKVEPSKPKPQTPEVSIPQGWLQKSLSKILRAELMDLPSDRMQETIFEKFLVPFSLVLIAVVAAFFLNYFRVFPIPGLETLREPLPTPIPIATPTPNTPTTPRYGFPIMPDIAGTPVSTPIQNR